MMYLAQTENDSKLQLAQAQADQLGLKFEYCFTGYGELGDAMVAMSAIKVAEPCPI